MNNIVVLQHYWWFIIALLAGTLAFLLFVQGANSMLYSLPKNSKERMLLVNVTGRKWEITFTTLVVFGGALFASFPLFYSTSFGGAYWLWMCILVTFVLQAVSYEFQSKPGNVLGRSVYQLFMIINGLLGPFLLGVALSLCFMGAPFLMDKSNLTELSSPIISRWMSPWYGIESLFNGWNVLFGFVVLLLSRFLGLLYIIHVVREESIQTRSKQALWLHGVAFVILFAIYFVKLMVQSGPTIIPNNGSVFLAPYKYWHNLLSMPAVIVLLAIGVLLILYGFLGTLFYNMRSGIWWSGAGTVCSVTCLFLLVGFNNTPILPSSVSLQDSLTLSNSSSSLVTLQIMAVVTLLLPIVLGYTFIAWRMVDKRGISLNDMDSTRTHVY